MAGLISRIDMPTRAFNLLQQVEDLRRMVTSERRRRLVRRSGSLGWQESANGDHHALTQCPAGELVRIVVQTRRWALGI